MRIISKYIIRQFIATTLFSLAAMSIIFIIVNLMESLDDFMDNKATFLIVVKYYSVFLPDIFRLLTPVAVLLGSLFTIGRLSNSNEITAMKSGGLSLYRLMIPLGILTIALSGFMIFFNGWLVPEANHVKLDMEQKYLHKYNTGGPIYNLYFRDSPMRNVIMQYYDGSIKTGNTIWIEDYNSETKPRLARRIEAKTITWDSTKNNWKLINIIDRTYLPEGIITKTIDTTHINLNITHAEIVELKRSTDEMNFEEFLGYINLLKQGGKDVRRLMITYYSNYAFPFASFIVIIFAVPFASVRKKGGLAIQIGAAMVVSFLYLLFTEISKNIGYSSNISPILTGWMANILFLIAGLVTIFRTRT